MRSRLFRKCSDARRVEMDGETHIPHPVAEHSDGALVLGRERRPRHARTRLGTGSLRVWTRHGARAPGGTVGGQNRVGSSRVGSLLIQSA